MTDNRTWREIYPEYFAHERAPELSFHEAIQMLPHVMPDWAERLAEVSAWRPPVEEEPTVEYEWWDDPSSFSGLDAFTEEWEKEFLGSIYRGFDEERGDAPIMLHTPTEIAEAARIYGASQLDDVELDIAMPRTRYVSPSEELHEEYDNRLQKIWGQATNWLTGVVTNVTQHVAKTWEDDPYQAPLKLMGDAWQWYWGTANTLLGNPFDWPRKAEEPRGVVWTGVMRGLSEAYRRVNTFADMVRTPMQRQMDIFNPRVTSFVRGAYAEEYYGPHINYMLPDEAWEGEYLKAKELQQVFDVEYQRLQEEGVSQVTAARRAMEAVREQEKIEPPLSAAEWRNLREEVKETFPESWEAFWKGDRSFPWSQEMDDAWKMSKYARYTHIVEPEKAIEFRIRLAAGEDPAMAADYTTNPVIESMYMIAFNPNWILGKFSPYGLALKGTKYAIKTPVKGTWDLFSHSSFGAPVAEFLTRGTAFAVGNKKAHEAVAVLDYTRKWMVEHGVTPSAENIQAAIKGKFPNMMADMPMHIKEAWRDTNRHFPAIYNALAKKWTVAKVEAYAQHHGLADSPAGIEQAAGAVWKEILKDVTPLVRNHYINFHIERLDPQIVKTWAAAKTKAHNLPVIGPIFKGVGTGLGQLKSELIDMWVGARPSWMAFHTFDTIQKMTIHGTNYFKGLGHHLGRWKSYTVMLPDEYELSKAKVLGVKTVFHKSDTLLDAHHELGRMIPYKAIGVSPLEDALHSRATAVSKIFPWVSWNYASHELMSSSASAKLFLTEFFDQLDAGWAVQMKKTIVAPIGYKGATVKLSAGGQEYIQQKLALLENPTPDAVRQVFEQAVAKKRLVVSNLAEAVPNQSYHIPKEILVSTKQELTALTPLGAEGPALVTEAQINAIFEAKARALVKAYNDTVSREMGIYLDSLPPDAPDVGTLLKAILAEPDNPGMSDLANSFNNIHAYSQKFNAMLHQKTADQMKAWDDLVALHKKTKGAQGMSYAELRPIKDRFFEERAQEWTKFIDTEAEALRRLADMIDTKQVARYGAPATAGHEFPREALDSMVIAWRKINNLEITKMRKMGLMSQLHDMDKHSLAESTQKAADETYRATLPLLQASEHRAFEKIKAWLVKEQFYSDILDLDTIASSDGWWYTGHGIANVPQAAKKTLVDQFRDLKKIYQQVLYHKTKPFSEIPVTPGDRAVLAEVGPQWVQDTHNLIDFSFQWASDTTSTLLYGPQETPQWMHMLRSFIPFPRWPMHNLPLWAELFSEKPRLLMTVQAVREIQEEFNRAAGVPERHIHHITLPRVLTDPVLLAMGLDNTEVRVNPWSFISIFSEVPGASPWKRRVFAEMARDADEIGIPFKAPGLVKAYTDQVGMGWWPWIEWTVGMKGLLGTHWYPFSLLGPYGTLVRYVSTEAFGYEIELDRGMRDAAAKRWNTLFSGVPSMQFDRMNPDLLLDWATGREIEGLIYNLPEEAAQLLQEAPLTPTQVREAIEGMKATGEWQGIRAQVMPIFDMEAPQMVEAIELLDPAQQAVFWDELAKAAAQLALRKKLFTDLMGHTFGPRFELIPEAEREMMSLRYERRLQQNLLGAGEDVRDFNQQFWAENPKYGLVSTWRFSEFPWETTAQGLVAERIDSIISDKETEYYNWNRQHRDNTERAVEEFIRHNPGDKHGLRALRNLARDERNEQVEKYNEELRIEILKTIQAYKDENPWDHATIRRLEEGFITDQYVGTILNEARRQQLVDFVTMSPTNEEGLNQLFRKLYEEQKLETPPTVKKKWPGIKDLDALGMDIRFRPGIYHTEEEMYEFLKGDIFMEMTGTRPRYDDYEDRDVWDKAVLDWEKNFTNIALSLPEVTKQIELLMQNGGLTEAEAREVVAEWYTKEEYDRNWLRFDNIYEALERVYADCVVAEWYDEFYGEILPLRDTVDYEVFAAAREEFFQRAVALDAIELIPYAMDLYEDRWTPDDLFQAWDGIVMPAFRERQLLDAWGERALNSHIDYYYYQLPGEERRMVRDRLDPAFVNVYLAGNKNQVSPQLRGQWIDALAAMVGDTVDWRNLPGMDELSWDKGAKSEQIPYGLPRLPETHREEYEQAMELEAEYWRLRELGDPRADELEQDPLRRKYFGRSTPKGYFWSLYYDQVPPGWATRELRENPAVAIVLQRDVRLAVADDPDYDRASEVIEHWLMWNMDLLREHDLLNPEEWEEYRRLAAIYYDIPPENRKEREAFREAHPLFEKFRAPPKEVTESAGTGTRSSTTTSRKTGGSVRRSPTTNLPEAWTIFKERVGTAFNSVIRMVMAFHRTGEFLGPATEAYLRKLHGEIGGTLSFEDWIQVLMDAWSREESGAPSRVPGQRVPSAPTAPPQPRYTGGRVASRRIYG